jgi:hypothetical protein
MVPDHDRGSLHHISRTCSASSSPANNGGSEEEEATDGKDSGSSFESSNAVLGSVVEGMDGQQASSPNASVLPPLASSLQLPSAAVTAEGGFFLVTPPRQDFVASQAPSAPGMLDAPLLCSGAAAHPWQPGTTPAPDRAISSTVTPPYGSSSVSCTHQLCLANDGFGKTSGCHPASSPQVVLGHSRDESVKQNHSRGLEPLMPGPPTASSGRS